MKIFSKEHKEALELKQRMDEVENKHLKFLNKEIKTKKQNKDFEKINAKFEKEENNLYAKYYNHMHNALNLPLKDDSCLKYKDGFVDIKYINDKFKQKNKKAKRSK